MSTFDIIGVVPYFTGTEFHLVAENSTELQIFVNKHQCTTRIDKTPEGKLKIKIRGLLVSKCEPGKRIAYTITVKNSRFSGLEISPYKRHENSELPPDAASNPRHSESNNTKSNIKLPNGNINPCKIETSHTRYNRNMNITEV